MTDPLVPSCPSCEGVVMKEWGRVFHPRYEANGNSGRRDEFKELPEGEHDLWTTLKKPPFLLFYCPECGKTEQIAEVGPWVARRKEEIDADIALKAMEKMADGEEIGPVYDMGNAYATVSISTGTNMSGTLLPRPQVGQKGVAIPWNPKKK